MKLLEEQLRCSLGIGSLTIFKIDTSSLPAKEVLLRKLWGES